MVSWFNQELTGYPGSPKNLKPGTKTETKKPENVPERNQNRISVSENFWFRQEDFGFICSLKNTPLPAHSLDSNRIIELKLLVNHYETPCSFPVALLSARYLF